MQGDLCSGWFPSRCLSSLVVLIVVYPLLVTLFSCLKGCCLGQVYYVHIFIFSNPLMLAIFFECSHLLLPLGWHSLPFSVTNASTSASTCYLGAAVSLVWWVSAVCLLHGGSSVAATLPHYDIARIQSQSQSQSESEFESESQLFKFHDRMCGFICQWCCCCCFCWIAWGKKVEGRAFDKCQPACLTEMDAKIYLAK